MFNLNTTMNGMEARTIRINENMGFQVVEKKKKGWGMMGTKGGNGKPRLDT